MPNTKHIMSYLMPNVGEGDNMKNTTKRRRTSSPSPRSLELDATNQAALDVKSNQFVVNVSDQDTSDEEEDPATLQQLTDIPPETLTYIASFLSKPSQALLACSLTAPSESWKPAEFASPPVAASQEGEDGQNGGHDEEDAPEAQVGEGEDERAPQEPGAGAAPQPTNRGPNTISRAILLVGEEHTAAADDDGIIRDGSRPEYYWSNLDFAELEPALASRLSDADLHAILSCIDAGQHLKVLKLTNLLAITGSGLTPLRGSSVLEQIDLSLVGKYVSPDLEYSGQSMALSEEATLPILHSVMDSYDSALRQVQLPKLWRQGTVTTTTVNEEDGTTTTTREKSPALIEFLECYDVLLEYLGGTCPHCNECGWGNSNEEGHPWTIEDQSSPFYGLQEFICYDCKRGVCVENTEEFACGNRRCMECEKFYCRECVSTEQCHRCGDFLCRGCGDLKTCEGKGCNLEICPACSADTSQCCNKTMCHECAPQDTCAYGCGRSHCRGCFSVATGDDIECCPTCGVCTCSKCRYLEYSKNGPENACADCVGIVRRAWEWHARLGLPFPNRS